MSPRDAKSISRRDELERLRARSRGRTWIALATMIVALGVLFPSYVAVNRALAGDRAAGRTTSLGVLWQSEPYALIGVAAGLVLAFGGMLVAALSWMHAKHVEKGLADERR